MWFQFREQRNATKAERLPKASRLDTYGYLPTCDVLAQPARRQARSVAPCSPDGLAGKLHAWFTMQGHQEKHLRHVETLLLGARRSVALIECDGQRFLAGLGADGVTTLLPLNTACCPPNAGSR